MTFARLEGMLSPSRLIFLLGLVQELLRVAFANQSGYLNTVTVESFPKHIYQSDSDFSHDGFWFPRMLFYGRAEGLTQSAGYATDLVRYLDSNGIGFVVQWSSSGLSATVVTATANYTSRAWKNGDDPDDDLSLSGYFQLYINYDYMQIKWNTIPGEAVPLPIDVSSCGETHDTYGGLIANENCFFGTVGQVESRTLSIGLISGRTSSSADLAGKFVIFSNRRTDDEDVTYCWNGDEEQTLASFPATLTSCDFDFPFKISGQFRGGPGNTDLIKYEDDSESYGLRVTLTTAGRLQATLTTPGKVSTSLSDQEDLLDLAELTSFVVVVTTELIQVTVSGTEGTTDSVDLSSCATGESRPYMHCVNSFSWAEDRMKIGYAIDGDAFAGTISGLRVKWGSSYDAGFPVVSLLSGDTAEQQTTTEATVDTADYAARFLDEIEVSSFPKTVGRSHASFSDDGIWFDHMVFHGRANYMVADPGSEIDLVRYVDSNGYGFWVRWSSDGLAATLKTTYGTFTSRAWKDGSSEDDDLRMYDGEFHLYINFDYMQIKWELQPGEAIPLSTAYTNSCGQNHDSYGLIASEDCFFGTLTNTGQERSLVFGANAGSSTESDIQQYKMYYSSWRADDDEIVYCWNGEQIKSFTSFPNYLSSCDLEIPFNVKGQFRGGPGNTDLIRYQDDNEKYGLVVALTESGRLKATLTTAGKVSVSYSQQTGLIDKSGYTTFKVGVTSERIQVVVQGLSGTTDTVDLSSCTTGETNPWLHCVLGFDWDENRMKFGYPSTSGGEYFSGTISAVQTERRDEDDVINPTSLDGTINEDDDEETVAGSGSGDDATILIPILITLGATLLSFVIIAFFAWWSPTFAKALGLKWPSKLATTTTTAPTIPKPTAVVTPASAPSPISPASAPSPAAAAAVGVPVSKPTSMTVGKATVTDTMPEEVNEAVLAILKEPIVIPSYWTNNSEKAKDLVQTSSKVRLAVQELMNATWRGVVTKDRSALAGAGAEKKVQHFEVVQVNRNENAKTYLDYAKRRRQIRAELKEEDFLDRVLTSQANFEDLGANVEGANEFFMFHGSKPSSVTNIVSNDFMVKLAGTRRGTLYGPGIYFAESSSKADEYADDDKSGIYRGLYAMLLCRVTLGKSLYVDEAFPDGKKLQDACVGSNATHHSVLGDREKTRGTYREFIIFDNNQVYPEYVIIYRRAEQE